MQTIDEKARISLARRLGMMQGALIWMAEQLERELRKDTPNPERLTRLAAQMRKVAQHEVVG